MDALSLCGCIFRHRFRGGRELRFGAVVAREQVDRGDNGQRCKHGGAGEKTTQSLRLQLEFAVHLDLLGLMVGRVAAVDPAVHLALLRGWSCDECILRVPTLQVFGNALNLLK